MTELFLDVRTLSPFERHARIFDSFDGLPVGGTVVLTADHDPRPLFHQFQAARTNAFSWTYADQGPELWRVRIGKTADYGREDGCCCGHCGG